MHKCLVAIMVYIEIRIRFGAVHYHMIRHMIQSYSYILSFFICLFIIFNIYIHIVRTNKAHSKLNFLQLLLFVVPLKIKKKRRFLQDANQNNERRTVSMNVDYVFFRGFESLILNKSHQMQWQHR